MRSFFCEDFCSESLPYFDWEFVQRRDSRYKGDTGWAGDSKIELFSSSMIRNISYTVRKARRAFYMWFRFCRPCTQESFGQRLGDERTRSDSRLKITFRMKPREGDVYRESRYSQVRSEFAREWESGRVVVECRRNQFIANLAIELFMKRFVSSAIQPNHFKSHDRMATAQLLI